MSQGSADTISDISLTMSVPHGFRVAQDLISFPRLAGTPIVIELQFETVPNTSWPSLTALATANYKNAKGEPRVTRCEIPLPFSMVARVVGSTKEPSIMFTLHTDEQPVHLPTLYKDMASLLPEDTANMVGFQYSNGEDAKIIASKNAGRYRIQADSFAAMAHLTDDFTERLRQHHGAHTKFSFQEEMPIKEYLGLIEEHHSMRMSLGASKELLAERSHQFRAIQKRLLIRFKERNPAPIDCLDKLLEGTYDEILELASLHEQQQHELAELASRLGCGTRLFVLLLRFRFDLDEENYHALLCHFAPNSVDNYEQGWEERVNASILFLLRTSMAKPGKAGEGAVTTHNPTLLVDVSKLKRHVQLIVDRLGKGLRPIKSEEK